MKHNLKKRKYCKDCVYHIPYIHNPDSKSEHVCGYFLETEINPVGQKVFKRAGDVHQCEACQTILQDSTKVITRACIEINSKWDCKYYKEKSPYKKAEQMLKQLIFRKK